MKATDVIKLIVSIGVSLLAGIIGALPNIEAIPTWYAGLNKPWFNPPNWVFGPVWTLLFILIGLALFFVWRAPKSRIRDIGISLWVIQLVVNVFWNYAFFGFRSPLFGVATIVPLWILIAVTIYQFNKVDRWAAYLMVPYIVWVSLATALNMGVYLLNQ
jgi:tryptophan-rich sensory protein